MITEALQHCTGIGPVRLAQLHEAGMRSWFDILQAEQAKRYRWQANLVEEVRQCAEALEQGNVRFFVDRLAPQDKWRILAQFFERTTFFDIETTGLDYDAEITVIICWHKDQLHTFVEHENLDDFLDLLDDVTLLTSFNGGSFDVPRVLESFHLPELPCPHLDLRWIGYHQGYSGGLKEIATAMRINRPPDLHSVDGADAVRWWLQWRHQQNATAREMLIRYCAADVLMLSAVAERLAGRTVNASGDELWRHLPPANSATALGVYRSSPASADENAQLLEANKPAKPSGSFLSRLRGRRDLLSRFAGGR